MASHFGALNDLISERYLIPIFTKAIVVSLE
jgi:hypothetical protein